VNIAFTICSNNYLAHAKTLGDSFLESHPDFKFVIVLVDRYAEGFDYSPFSKFTVIPVEDIPLGELAELQGKYNITELNTAVKPAYFHYLFTTFSADKVIYIDPDILVKSRFDEVLDVLDSKNIVITPHICSPVDDEFAPTDYHTIRGGVFNLGFIGLSQYPAVTGFLDWWHHRVIKYGYNNFALNMFYDQLWINYVPAFYDNYHILKHPGYNMANWNLHERVLSQTDDGQYRVNREYPLRFFHFSSYHYTRPDVICSYLTRFSFESRPDLRPLFDEYTRLLKANNADVIRRLPVHFFPHLNNPAGKAAQPGPGILRRGLSRVKRAARVLLKG